ncbi:MAG TPA: LysR substrate-binding domain-containing protein [Geminicoccus sp.]|jgi:DNA-binding transcriptional LysR family regulator|uniref:LysR substrate-binding domain-containing protein n=1 Tax=Geminicoccus sp. TaxID=2024832 RepID=UPI002E354292|nr:LysR substrate-binding domain-containing protein [Geminicoccus sp.]HEX2526286.1 LysR substrate-binding domain-containing protein [Geminicoccus sp.]
MLNLNDLHLFVQAVDCGGFAQAGRRLSMPKSTISKRVGELEARLGTRLIHRTSRSFKLSELGRDFYEHAQAALIEAEAAESVVRRQLAEPSGTVRITASVPVAQFQLAAHLPALAQAYPGMSLVVHATDRFVDLIQEGFDIAVRSHFGLLPDSGLIQRRASADPVVVVAAPSYLDQRGAPGRPEDIARHDGLLTAPAATVWRLRADGGQEVQVAPRARMVADESVLLLEAAAAGLGLACLPSGICRAEVERGRLVSVLPGWTAGAVTTTILMPPRRGQLPGVRAVASFLAERL